MRWSCAIVVVMSVPVASAEPEYDPDPVAVETPDAGPLWRGYLQLGVMIGAEHSQTVTGTRADAGVRLGHSVLSLHAAAMTGGPIRGPSLPAIGDETSISGSLLAWSAGVEARACGGTALCGVIGLDIGYEHLVYTDTDKTDASMSTSGDFASVVAIPRLQLDFGGDHVRVRPTLEFPIGPHLEATQVSIALALQI